MKKNISKLFNDIFGIFRIYGITTGFKYLFNIFYQIVHLFQSRNLIIVDKAWGADHTPSILDLDKKFRVFGKSVLSGIREIYIRDVYLRGGILKIADGDIVVDLGANMGNFTNLALA